MRDLIEFDLAALGVTTKYTPPSMLPSYSIVFSKQGAQVKLPPGLTARALVLDADTAQWVVEAARKLESLGKLKKNWDSYDGLPLSPGARRMTFDALGWLRMQDLPVPYVVLGSAGTVHLEWHSHGKKLEIGFDGQGAIEFLKVDRSGNWEENENVNTDVRKKLESLTEWLRNA
jgi:hypothetical protein